MTDELDNAIQRRHQRLLQEQDASKEAANQEESEQEVRN
jgi:hypothetical protein